MPHSLPTFASFSHESEEQKFWGEKQKMELNFILNLYCS